MYLVFIVLTILVSILMIGIVLIQKSKGGGLSSQFGGGNQVLGVRGTNTFLEKSTWTLAALILVLSVCSAYAMPKADRIGGVRADAKDVQTAAPAPQGNAFGTSAKEVEAPAAAATEAAAPAAAEAAADAPAAQE